MKLYRAAAVDPDPRVYWFHQATKSLMRMALDHRRNAVFCCMYGNLGLSVWELRDLPLSKFRELCADVIYWKTIENKNTRGS